MFDSAQPVQTRFQGLVSSSSALLSIAEGVETIGKYEALCGCGVSLMQGFLFAKPAFEALPDFKLPARRAA